ncbi:hypothetical protein [Flavihumibacter profundi]|uniref:hypothetical protein n=1 Tax=Flavihumibacter profundi TaxID=2716883 RepID=UPI001CC47120|nr:hypothetical protein [Flavihumibacter profundi]MBZ5856529.1 hypothetical protein [Flavihumibacter profundi]
MASINCKTRIFVTVLIVLFLDFNAHGQDTLPSFSAVIRSGNKVLISWTNLFGNKTKQLSIQRSRDSLRQFKTIVSIPDPTVLLNGYVDNKSTDSNYYYRLYILLDSGRYLFSPSRKPTKYIPPTPKKQIDNPDPSNKNKSNYPDAGVVPPRPVLTEVDLPNKAKGQMKEPEKTYTIKKGSLIVDNLKESELKRFRDSVSLKTKDTISSISKDTIFIKPFIPKDVYKLSKYIFPDKTGLLHIELPDAQKRKYQIRFFDENKTFLFEVKNIRDPVLLLDKANFEHAGWFLFELYDDYTLIEKNRFFIGKDF